MLASTVNATANTISAPVSHLTEFAVLAQLPDYTDAHAYGYTDAHAYGYTDAHAYGYTDAHAYGHAFTHANG